MIIEKVKHVAAEPLEAAEADILFEDGRSGDAMQTFTIITTTPNELCAPILPRGKWSAWRGEREADADELRWMIDDGSCDVELFAGPTARRDALRYVMRTYGHFRKLS